MSGSERPVSHSFQELWALIWSGASVFVKMRLASVLVLVFTASILTPLGPVALKLIVDRFTDPSAVGIVPIGVLIGLYVLSQWLSRSIGEVRGLVYARAERRMFRSLSERLFEHVMQLPLRFHLERQTGAINQTLENGMQGYQMILHHLVFTVLPVSAQLGTIIFILLKFHQPVFLGIFCLALVCYAAVFASFAIRVAGLAKSASAAHIAANAAMTDSILNYETVKYFAAEEVVQERVRMALLKTEEEWVGFYRRYAVNGLVVATVYGSFLGLGIAYAVHQVAIGRMTVGDFVLVNSYMLQVMQPVEMLGYAVQGVSQGSAMLTGLLGLFRQKTEQQASAIGCVVPATPVSGEDSDLERENVSSTAPGIQMEAERDELQEISARGTMARYGAGRHRITEAENLRGPGELVFDRVKLSYRSDRVILNDVSFTLPAGKTLGIVGPSGSGKSTIVRLLVRLLDSDEGRITIDGVPLREFSLEVLRAAVAVVPQDTILFNDTIRYNIALGKRGCTQVEIEDAARLAHLHDFIMSLPEGYDTQVGERGVKLSGGEKQRLSIARAALKQPRIYVFDEATSSLDSHTEVEILNNLRDISRFRTTVVIAHRLSTVVHADEIVVLEGGTIVERGSHSALLEKAQKYAALWNAQQGSAVA